MQLEKKLEGLVLVGELHNAKKKHHDNEDMFSVQIYYTFSKLGAKTAK